MGADVCLDPSVEDVEAAIREHTGGIGPDIVVDAVGSQLSPALAVVRKGGRVLLFGMNANASAGVRQFDITRDELTVFGSYVGVNTFPKATRILEQGVVDLSPMVTHRVPLEELPMALEANRAGRAVKTVIELGDAPG
jgi:threonine dehydrogenase-like Zn-dependent dehydrogenase